MERSFHQRWKRSGMDFAPTRRLLRPFQSVLPLENGPAGGGARPCRLWRQGRKHSANVHFARLQGEHPPVPYAACGRKVSGLGPEKGGENAGWHFTPA